MLNVSHAAHKPKEDRCLNIFHAFSLVLLKLAASVFSEIVIRSISVGLYHIYIKRINWWFICDIICRVAVDQRVNIVFITSHDGAVSDAHIK
jgi:3-methyladenine DNA glycosylase AlkD